MSNLNKLKEVYARRYGNEYVNVDGKKYSLDVVPTGSLMMDYKTGIGGFPYGGTVEVFGGNRIGKSSAVLYPVLGNVQKQGKIPALIQVEPRFRTEEDKEWARRIGGFDPDNALILEPDHADEAFDMLRDLVFDDVVQYIAIDSLGALGNRTSAVKDGKPKAYGISGAVTSVMNDILPRLHKNKIGLLVLNQQRQTGQYNGTTMYDSPGGEGLHHNMMMRIQLKPNGKQRFNATVDGDTVLVGRDVKAVFVKNNLSESQEKTATFNFFFIETDKYGIGIDKAGDVVNTGVLTGVIKRSGAWYTHPTFPKIKSGESKINGVDATGTFLVENPDAYQQVRAEVLESMVRKELNAKAKLRDIKHANVSVEADTDEDE
jgi:recombination protein RecA